jgi:hypothetical protein
MAYCKALNLAGFEFDIMMSAPTTMLSISKSTSQISLKLVRWIYGAPAGEDFAHARMQTVVVVATATRRSAFPSD